jgi:elongator complex protein 2
VATLKGHTSSINCLAGVANAGNIFASGAADATVRIWKITCADDAVNAVLLQTIQLQPRFFPLALSLSKLGSKSALVLAVAGTRSIIQVYVADGGIDTPNFGLKATLTGHDGWVRSLDFTCEEQGEDGDLLLASASQDKYIRLWRIHEGVELPAARTTAPNHLSGTLERSLSNKAHRFEASKVKYNLTFEALLLGHEDWIYTALWKRTTDGLRLLSSSADNSLAIWESETNSGVWICSTRLGEISAQKGSTTATGSAGGFWIGLWSPNGDTVVSLGKAGSWRLWTYKAEQDRWLQGLGISGHVKSVKGIAWAKDGSYLLSTSSDQTTRLHAKWKSHQEEGSWHELARPQIHGYDLNCIDSLGQGQFISGADEKLLRVFDEPSSVAQMLENLCGIKSKNLEEMPGAANIPVLGLSNKAVEILHEIEELSDQDDGAEAPDKGPTSRISNFDIDHPPLEDHLSRHTLWPEKEKLYGHGYEISCVAASHDGSLVATACKASSIDHAVIRIYETIGWHEVKPPLTAHSLTVTCLRFSTDDKMLLSVGRDRQWTVFERDSKSQKYTVKTFNPKGHARMILGAAWAPPDAGRSFVTAGRDKTVKLWKSQGETFECLTSIPAQAAVTSVDFLQQIYRESIFLAIGTENGDVLLQSFRINDLASRKTHAIPRRYVAFAEDHHHIG